ncbi:mediator complex subunit [Malassezia sp. CBS 17886]|nr:mediator complex subunit [Malassezia sp. CBS 17886]
MDDAVQRAAPRAQETHALVDVPRDQLLQELPVEQTDLVPLSVLVERVSNNAYQTLQNLGETLASLPNEARRAKIFTAALDLRKQFIKLLVIVRWAKDSDELNLARNIIGMLADQQWAPEDVFSGLTHIRKLLPHARLCEADLHTAVDVFRTGTYSRLPAAIRDSAVSQAPMSDADALRVIEGLDQMLLVRLTCHEVVPVGLQLERIADGKAYLEAPALYRMSLTADGAAQHDRWWLLDFSFSDPDGLAPEVPAQLTSEYLDHVYAATEAILGADADAAASALPQLCQLHQFLEQQSLQRQLHILHLQTQRMARQNWGPNLRSVLSIETWTLEVTYWAAQAGANMLHGRLRLRIEEKPRCGVDWAVSELVTGTADVVLQKTMALTWAVDAAVTDALDSNERALPPPVHGMESILLAAMDRHSRAAMRVFGAQIGARASFGPASCRARAHAQTGFGPRHSLEVDITQTVRLLLYISAITGRIGLKPLDLRGRSTSTPGVMLSLSVGQNASMQRLADRINRDLGALADALGAYQRKCHTRELEQLAEWIGLPFQSIALRAGELDRIGVPGGHALLFLPLEVLPSFYLLVYAVPSGGRQLALVSVVRVPEEGKSLQAIGSVKFLDRALLSNYTVSPSGALVNVPMQTAYGETGPERHDIMTEEVQLAHYYCIATVVYSHLEEQLRLKLVPFMLVGATTATPPPPTGSADPLLPSLCVSAAQLLEPYADVAGPNVSLQVCDWWLPEKRSVEIAFQIKLRPGMPRIHTLLFEHVSLDTASGIMHFSCKQVATSVSQFLQCWGQVAHMCTLMNVAVGYRSDTFSTALLDVAKQQVVFTYGFRPADQDGQLCARLRFRPVAGESTQGAYSLRFGCLKNGQQHYGTRHNPHELLAEILEQKLDAALQTGAAVWKGLFRILQTTLPVLNMLADTLHPIAALDQPEVEVQDITWYRLRLYCRCVNLI